MNPSRRGLALPESAAISALLSDVMTPAAQAPAGPSAGDFWAGVNWDNAPPPAAPANRPADPARTPVPAAARRPAPAPAGRLADLPAADFLAAVNWGNDPGRAAALPPAGGPALVADPWAADRYLAQFTWD